MERGVKLAHRRPQIYQLLLLRVIDVKYMVASPLFGNIVILLDSSCQGKASHS